MSETAKMPMLTWSTLAPMLITMFGSFFAIIIMVTIFLHETMVKGDEHILSIIRTIAADVRSQHLSLRSVVDQALLTCQPSDEPPR